MKTIKINSASGTTLVAFAVLTLFIASCASSKTASVDESYVAKEGFIMAKPLIADVKVENRKIEGKAVIKNSLYGKEVAQLAARNLAVIDAIKRGDADVIVQPVYIIESTSQFTTATVSGYAAKYKDFREVTPQDTLAFRVRRKLNNYYEGVPGVVSISKKKK